MSGVLQANVAGIFYPANPYELRAMVRGYLRASTPASRVAKAIIAPHAGYRYSASIAAAAYRRLAMKNTQIDTLLVLGPAHRIALNGIAMSQAAYYATPLGQIPLHHRLQQDLAQLPGLAVIEQAFSGEHSLEVHLPFLQCLFPSFQLVPLVVGRVDPTLVANVLNYCWTQPNIAIVISSDLSHYETYERANQHDAHTAAQIETLDYEPLTPKDACGCFPVKGLLQHLKAVGGTIARVQIANSGDTAGPKDKVVGYGAFATE